MPQQRVNLSDSGKDAIMKLDSNCNELSSVKVNTSDIVDNMTSSDTNKPLSANQGREGHKQRLEASIIAEMTLLNLRWERDKADDAKVTQFEVTITTANTAATVDISTAKRNRTSYNVTYELITLTGGTAGDILISDKQVNGFKAKYNGTATSIKVLFKLQGGMI